MILFRFTNLQKFIMGLSVFIISAPLVLLITPEDSDGGMVNTVEVVNTIPTADREFPCSEMVKNPSPDRVMSRA